MTVNRKSVIPHASLATCNFNVNVGEVNKKIPEFMIDVNTAQLMTAANLQSKSEERIIN